MEDKSKRRITGGMILIALGILIILNNTTDYRFSMSWPILLIVIAAGTLIQNFKDLGGWIIGMAGIIFLIKETWNINISALAIYLLPLLVILVGISIIMRQYRKHQS